MATISWSLDIEVQNGPKLAGTQVVPVDAYDSTQVTIAPTKDSTIDVQPGTVSFVAIVADRYTPNLTYVVNGGTAHIVVDGPQVLSGGAVALLGLGTASPATLKFTNSDTKPVSVQVLVGRS